MRQCVDYIMRDCSYTHKTMQFVCDYQDQLISFPDCSMVVFNVENFKKIDLIALCASVFCFFLGSVHLRMVFFENIWDSKSRLKCIRIKSVTACKFSSQPCSWIINTRLKKMFVAANTEVVILHEHKICTRTLLSQFQTGQMN